MKTQTTQSIIKLFLIMPFFFATSSIFAQKKAIKTKWNTTKRPFQMKTSIESFFLKLILITIIFIGPLNLYSQKKMTKLGADITFHISELSQRKKQLNLEIVQDYIHGNLGGQELTASQDSNGFYKFHLPHISSVASFSIALYEDTLVTGLGSGYVEEGDNILIDFTGKDLNRTHFQDYKFSGRGSQKLIAKRALETAAPNNIIENFDGPYDLKYLNKLKTITDSNYLFYKQILNIYRSKLSDPVFKIMDANIYGYANAGIFHTLNDFFILHPKTNITFKDSILLYLPKIENKKFAGNSKWASNSIGYLYYLTTRAYGTSMLKYNSANIQDVYKELLLQNVGPIREKVLLTYLTKSAAGGRIGDDINYVFTDALKYIVNPTYKKIMTQLGNSKKVGAKAYPFNLPDSTGKMITLNDFKGKTIMIDCWFTGCGVCADVAKTIDENVLPKYLNNENVVFISVCVDRSEKLWKESVKSGLYTNHKSINLFTEGLGTNHSFLKNYQFQGFPKLMLIDKNGNIFSSSLPREPKDMIEVIDRALQIE